MRVDPKGKNPIEGAFSIPGYDLLETIGEGGMGIVYRAIQHQPSRTVAIKVLTPIPGNPLTIQAFEREARLMAALQHPNVVTIYDCGEVAGRYYLVMEHVSGPPLRSLLKPGQHWPITRAAPLLDSIARR